MFQVFLSFGPNNVTKSTLEIYDSSTALSHKRSQFPEGGHSEARNGGERTMCKSNFTRSPFRLTVGILGTRLGIYIHVSNPSLPQPTPGLPQGKATDYEVRGQRSEPCKGPTVYLTRNQPVLSPETGVKLLKYYTFN